MTPMQRLEHGLSQADQGLASLCDVTNELLKLGDVALPPRLRLDLLTSVQAVSRGLGAARESVGAVIAEQEVETRHLERSDQMIDELQADMRESLAGGGR